MKIAEFIRMSATEMDKYLKEKIPNSFLLTTDYEIYSLLDIDDFQGSRYRADGIRRIVIKKRDTLAGGLGGILPSSSLDLFFYDIYGRPVGNLWRYNDGTAAFSSAVLRRRGEGETTIRNVLEMLEISYDINGYI